jgi:MoaA/NifB/PqqE/SkfB family radical SAM enzyme
MDDNLDDIEPLILLSRELGVTYMVNLYSFNRGQKPRREPQKRVTARLLELKAKYPDFVTLTTYIERLDEAIAEGGIGDCQCGRLLLNIDPQGQVARCTETLDEPVGNILKDEMAAIRKRLARVQKEMPCAQCWTSCRGFAESMFQPPRWRQLREFHRSVRSN